MGRTSPKTAVIKRKADPKRGKRGRKHQAAITDFDREGMGVAAKE